MAKTLTAAEAKAQATLLVQGGYHQLYENRANRDAVFAQLKKLLPKSQQERIRRSSTGWQAVHPQYVSDYDKPFQTGFGNMDYKTGFSNLYKIGLDRL